MAENQRGKAAYFSLRETTRNSTIIFAMENIVLYER